MNVWSPKWDSKRSQNQLIGWGGRETVTVAVWDVAMQDFEYLHRLATTQRGLVSRRQLGDLGFTIKGVAGLIRSGQFVERVPGVLRRWDTIDEWIVSLLEATLTSVPRPVASHRSALRLWGFRSDSEIEISVRYPRRCVVPGARVHRSRDLELVDITTHEGIPLTTPIRTLCDSGLIYPEHEVKRMVNHGISTGVVTRAALWNFRHRVGKQGRNGAGVLDRVLEALPAMAERAESGPEVELIGICLGCGLPAPKLQWEVESRHRRFRFDLAYPDARVGIEFDGRSVHSDEVRFVEDRRRQNLLVLDGWTILRFTWADINDRPGAVAREIRSAVNASHPVL